jgi:hypothetical protein
MDCELDQLDIHKHVLKALQWAIEEVGDGPADRWQICNLVTPVLAMALWEFKTKDLEYVSCRISDSNSTGLEHVWLRWKGRISIDLTIEQFSEHTDLMERMGQPLNHQGVRYVFGDSPWHNSFRCPTISPVDENLVKKKYICLEKAKEVFGELPRCQKAKSQHIRKTLGVQDS